MTTRVIKSDRHKADLIALINARSTPFTVTITSGAHRTEYQNRTAFMWYKEIAEQLGDQSAEDVRKFCKLTLGVAILRHENEAFRIEYDKVVKPMSYENKLAIMGEPFNLPISSIMTVAQKTKYLDEIQRHFLQLGIVLTQPKERIGKRDD